MTKPLILLTALTKGKTLTKIAKAVPTYKVNKKDKDEDGNIYLQAICSGSRSRIVKLSTKLIRNKRSKTTETSIISFLKKRLK